MSETWRSAAPVVLLVLIADQATKLAAERLLALHVEQPVWPFLSLALSHNRGIAFGLLHDAPAAAHTAVLAATVAIAAWLAALLHRLRADERALLWPLALILGGALGNGIDRAARGAVVDFLALHYGPWYWPTFNVADAAITAGVLLFIALSLRGARRA